MRYAKTVYIFNISNLFSDEIASRIGSEWDRYPGYQIKIKKNIDGGSIALEKLFYNGNTDKPPRVKRIIYPIITTQSGFAIPETCIRREEYKNGKLTRLKE